MIIVTRNTDQDSVRSSHPKAQGSGLLGAVRGAGGGSPSPERIVYFSGLVGSSGRLTTVPTRIGSAVYQVQETLALHLPPAYTRNTVEGETCQHHVTL